MLRHHDVGGWNEYSRGGIGLWSVTTGSKVNRKLFASNLLFSTTVTSIDFFFPFGSHCFWDEQSPESPVDDVVSFHVRSEEPPWWVMIDEVGFAFGVCRISVTLPTHCQYQYKIESFRLISPFAIYGVLRNKPDGSELMMLVARHMILAGATALNPGMANLTWM